MSSNSATDVYCLRLSKQQSARILEFIGQERMGDYLRRLIKTDYIYHGFEWPGYEFLDNAARRKEQP